MFPPRRKFLCISLIPSLLTGEESLPGQRRPLREYSIRNLKDASSSDESGPAGGIFHCESFSETSLNSCSYYILIRSALELLPDCRYSYACFHYLMYQLSLRLVANA